MLVQQQLQRRKLQSPSLEKIYGIRALLNLPKRRRIGIFRF